MNPHEFLKAHKVCFSAERVDSRPDAQSNWDRSARHWRYELSNARYGMTGYFSQGSAHKDAPTDIEVLECLVMDARTAEDCQDVLDLAAEFGYDLDTTEDRERARNVYEGCRKTANDLNELFGDTEELFEIDFEEAA